MARNDAPPTPAEPWTQAPATTFTRNLHRDRFFETIHSNLSVDATAYAIVNDGRRLLGCDRIAILELCRNRARLLAISGVDELSRRGYVGQTLEHLASLVAAGGEPIYYAGDSSQLAPQIQNALEEYVNHANVRRLAAVPLHSNRVGTAQEPGEFEKELIGLLIVEEFRTLEDEAGLWARIEDIRPQVSLALRNALAHQRMPLARLSRGLQVVGDYLRFPRTIFCLIAMSICLLSIFLVKTDLLVRARGSLQPQQRREVFATIDATVLSVVAAHGDAVRKGDLLVELVSPQLDLELSRVTGELRTAQRQLQAAYAQLWNAQSEGNDAVVEAQLAARQQQLTQQIKGLESQRELLERERQRMLVRAPIDGTVQTWNATQLLADRPVRRGQSLMTVANPDSQWTAELSILDQDVGSVMMAQESIGEDLEVTLMLATDPVNTYTGRIERTAVASHVDASGETQLQVDVAVAREDAFRARSGAEVIAKIHCGRKSIAYVWFRSLVNAIQRQLFL